MSRDIKIRWGWLKFMYILTIVMAGGCGLGMLIAPELIKSKGNGGRPSLSK